MQGFRSSAEIFRWAEGFINNERGGAPLRGFRLERMEILSGLAGCPERCCPVIHVAGSKGKGSVTALMSSILEAGGIRTARYASPHVSDYRERISGGGGFFSEETYIDAGEELAAVTEALGKLPAEEQARFSGGEGAAAAPTFFELLTLYFFLCARKTGVQAMVVETGLGGRLDATNIVDPLISVITRIEKEHTEYLGHTLAAIAGEKAGIIKGGRPLFLAAQEEEALAVFRERAAAQGSPLHYLPAGAEVSDLRLNREGTLFNLRLPSIGENFRDLRLPVPGELQAQNAALAVLAALSLREHFPSLGETAIRTGLAAFSLPARFERLHPNPPLVIDGAHTPESTAACVKTFAALYGKGGVLLFGCAADKDAASMAEALCPYFSLIVITAPGTFKKSSPRTVFDAFIRARKGKAEPEILLEDETGAAIRQALEHSRERNLPLLGAGSFYLAGEIKAAVGEK